MTEVCQLHDSMVQRLEQCEANIKTLQNHSNDLNVRYARMETKLDYVTIEIQKLSVKIDTIIGQPVKRWDNIVNVLITSGIVALVTFFFARGG